MRVNFVSTYASNFYLQEKKNNCSKKVNFSGALEDEFFKEAKSGDYAGQIKSLKDIRFDINEIDPETGCNFLHMALKSGNKSIINQALILLSKKTVNDKSLSDSVVSKTDNAGKKPYEYSSDAGVINILQKITGKDIKATPYVKQNTISESIQAKKQTVPADNKLNELPVGTKIEIPSFDDDDEAMDIEPILTPLVPLALTSLPLIDIAGHNEAKGILINRIVNPLSQGKLVIDSGFLIHDTGSNGKTFLLNSLEKSLNRKRIDAQTLGAMIDDVITNSEGDKIKQKKGKAGILSQNIVQVASVQELLSVVDFAKENYAETKQQTVIFVDEIKALLPDIQERSDIIKKYLQSNPVLSGDEFDSFVKLTSGFTYLNLVKFINRLDGNKAASFEYIEHELQKYAKENNLGKLTDKGTTANYDTKLKRKNITKPAGFSDVAGMEDIKYKFQTQLIDRLKPEVLERFKKYGNRSPVKTGFLLFGTPGTGKTYIVEALAGEMGLPLYQLDSAIIKDSFVGKSEQNIKQIFEQMERKFEETGEYSILFIDEATDLLGKREDSNNIKSNLVDLFLQKINNSAERGIITIVATNFKDKIDGAILSRLGKHINVPLPDAELRKAMINLEFSKVSSITQNITEDERNDLASRLAGFSSRDISNILSSTIDNHLVGEDTLLNASDFKREINSFAQEHDLPEINDRNKTSAYDTFIKRVKITKDDPQTLDDLGGMNEVKEKLLEAVSFETNNPDVAKRLKSHGTENASSVLLHGEPGSGKTFILKALAAHMNLPLYEFKLSEQGSKFVHETTENIGKIFAQLKEKYQKTGEKSILLIVSSPQFLVQFHS